MHESTSGKWEDGKGLGQSADKPLDALEQAELERLRAEIAEMQVAAPGGDIRWRSSAASTRTRRRTRLTQRRAHEALRASRRPIPTAGVLFLAALAIVAVGLADLAAGPYLTFSVLYLLPVAVVAWRSGPWVGAAATMAVLAVSLTADLSYPGELASAGALTRLAPWWNGLMRGAACGLVIALVEMQRRALARESWLARTDPLTGVANRRHLIDAVTVELHRGERYQHPFSLVMLDVDRFKHINDEFGHATGDAILRAVADRLTQRLRHLDLIARVGGDEFALLLPETDEQQARRVVDTVSAPLPVTVPLDQHAHAEMTLDVQLSAGAATVSPTDTHRTVEDVLAEADGAMYEAKRNRSDVPQRLGDER